MGEMIHVHQAHAFRRLVGARDRLVFVLVGALVAVPVHHVQDAPADTLDARDVQRQRVLLVGDRVGSLFPGTLEGVIGVLDADREAHGARPMLFREVGRETVGLLVHQEDHVILTV